MKWRGAIVCLLLGVLCAASFCLFIEYNWLADSETDVGGFGLVPGRIRFVIWHDVAGRWDFTRIEAMDQGWSVQDVPTEWRSWRSLLCVPRVVHQYRAVDGAKVTAVSVPLWLLFGIVAVPTGIAWYRDRRPRHGCCGECGYDLRGNVSGRCPECGNPLETRNSL